MELQFEKRSVSCMSQVVRSVKDQELTQEVRLTQDLPDVGRVLAGWGQAILRGKEWQGSHLSVSGGIQAVVLYVPEDGSAPRVVDAWIPLQMKWDGAVTDREGPMRVRFLLRFVDGRNLSARKILIRAGVSCMVEALKEEETEVFRGPAVPEDVQLLRRNYPVRLPREAGEKTFIVEQLLDPGSASVQQILAYTFRPEITDARVSTDKVALRGSGLLHIVFSDREGRIGTREFEVPFSALGELENAYENDARTDCIMAVTGLELDLEEEKLALKCSLVAQYIISDRTVLELVEDAYSTRREVGLRQEELHLPVILDEREERITARGDFPDTAMEGVDAQFWPGFPQVHRDMDRAEVEIPGRFQLLGYDREGNLRAATASWTGSTGMNVDAMGRMEAMTEPAGETRWIGTGNGMEVQAETKLRCTVSSGRGLPMITALELGPLQEPNRDRPSLILCRPGGRDLWAMAKAAGSSVGTIREANALEEEPQENRMLLIPIP